MPHTQGWWEPYYIASLSVVGMLVALLTIGPVRPWGTTFPGRLPFVGGRRVPYRAVSAIAGTFAILLFFMAYLYPFVNGLLHLKEPVRIPDCPPPTDGEGGWVVYAAYLPLLAWAPLLFIVVGSYYRRHAAARRSSTP